jgi:tetratricopeptide (TPR) repeat protein
MGCGSAAVDPKELPPVPVPVTRGVLTDEECRDIANRLNDALQSGDPAKANAIFSWDMCVERAAHGIDLPPQTRNEFLRGLVDGAKSQGVMFHEIVNAQKQGGKFKFLRIHEVDGEKRAMFRLVLANAGASYQDYLLTKDEAGTVKIYDVYVYVMGESISETLRRIVLQIAANENRGLLDRLAGREQLLVKHLGEVTRMITLTQQGDHAAALAIYDALPAEVSEQQFVLMIAVRAAQQSMNFPKYQQILETFRRAHPDNPGMNLVAIDYFALRGEHDKSLAAIDRLPAAIIDDAYVDVMRAGAFFAAKQFDEARKAADKAISKEGDVQHAYWMHVSISIEQGQFDETLKWLKTIDGKFPVKWRELLSLPQYDSFRASPQYREWQSYKGE